MSEKVYKICLSVPLGTRSGKLYLQETDGKADGWLKVMNQQNPLTGTVSKEGAVIFYGELKTLVETVSYTATGTIKGKEILLNLETRYGTYSIRGEEVSEV